MPRNNLEARARTLLDARKLLNHWWEEGCPNSGLYTILDSVIGTDWQRIESAPKDARAIMGCDIKGQFVMFWRGAEHLAHQDKPGWHITRSLIRVHPTHWKPLGELPE